MLCEIILCVFQCTKHTRFVLCDTVLATIDSQLKSIFLHAKRSKIAALEKLWGTYYFSMIYKIISRLCINSHQLVCHHMSYRFRFIAYLTYVLLYDATLIIATEARHPHQLDSHLHVARFVLTVIVFVLSMIDILLQVWSFVVI